MGLRRTMERQGHWLFRHRGLLPLGLLLLLIPALWLAPAPATPRGALLLSLFRTGCLLLAAAGLLLRVLAVGCAPGGTSGRNILAQEASQLNTTGAYSLVRHPLYLGNVLIYLGICGYPGVWWAVALAALLLFLYYERIMLAEEAYLRERFGEAFTAWAARTPAFLPRLRGWRRPALSFSLRTAARREYSGLFAIVVAFAIVHQGLDDLRRGAYVSNPRWMAALGVALLAYFALRTLKRKTQHLRVPGR